MTDWLLVFRCVKQDINLQIFCYYLMNTTTLRYARPPSLIYVIRQECFVGRKSRSFRRRSGCLPAWSI